MIASRRHSELAAFCCLDSFFYFCWVLFWIPFYDFCFESCFSGDLETTFLFSGSRLARWLWKEILHQPTNENFLNENLFWDFTLGPPFLLGMCSVEPCFVRTNGT